MGNKRDRLISSITRRKLLKGTAGGAAAGLAGCTGSLPGGGGGGGKLRFGQAKSPVEFDPVVLNDVPSAEVAGMVFDPLYDYNEGTKVVPKIANKEPEVSKGGQRWVVELNPDAEFQNGNAVTATDVKYTAEAPVKEKTENAGEFNMIDTVSVVDEQTVQFDLKFQFAPFKQYLTFNVVPKGVREKDKESFNKQQPLGSGPFQFEDWTEGEFVRVSRWEEYWDDPKPNLSEIEFVPVEEATTRITTLKTGKNDIIKGIPPKSWETVQNLENASIASVPGISYFYLAFNCNAGPTTDPKVREAVDYAVSMDDAVSKFVEPTGIRQYSPIPRKMAEDWGFPLDEWKGVPHEKDVDKAKQLFEEAGVPMDYSWKIIVPPDEKREQIGVSVANGLKEAGFSTAEVQRLDWGPFLDKYNTGKEKDYNMFTLGWAGSPDPDSFMYFLFGRTEDTLGVTNGSYFGNTSQAGKQAANKISEARKSTDRAKRKQLYTQAIDTILTQRAHLPAYALKNSFGVRSTVSDFHAHPVNQFSIVSDYNNVSIE